MPKFYKSSIAALFVIILLAGALGVVVKNTQIARLIKPKAAATSVDIVFVPAENRESLFTGTPFEVEIDLETGITPQPQLAAFSGVLVFDPHILQVKEVKRLETPGVPEFASVEVLDQPNKVNKTGQLFLLATNQKQTTTGPVVKVAKVTFVGIAPGTANLRVKSDSSNPKTQPKLVQNSTQNPNLPISAALPLGRYTIILPPTPTPTPQPTATPTPSPLPSPTPTSLPTPTPTATPRPTVRPTISPTTTPTPSPVVIPSTSPIPTPTEIFTAPLNYRSGGRPLAIALAALTTGSKPNVLIVNQDTNTVSILPNHGDGTFDQSRLANYTVGNDPRSIAVADFNRDGSLDFVVANRGSNTITVLKGNGDGTFNQTQALTLNVGSEPRAVTIGDFNQDGKADVAVANYGSHDVSVLLGNGDGTFGPVRNYPAGTNPVAIATHNLTADTKPDLVVANYTSSTVSVLTNSGDGTFAPKVDFAAVLNPDAIAIADFNKDGKLDLAVANYGANNVSIYIGNGNGTFAAARNYPAGSGPTALAAGDLNSDGKVDLIVTNDVYNPSLSLLINKGNGFDQPVSASAGSFPKSVAISDLNWDGSMDLVTANYTSNDISVLLHRSGSVKGVSKLLAQANITPTPTVPIQPGCTITNSLLSTTTTRGTTASFSTRGTGLTVTGAALVYVPPGGTLVAPLCSTFTLTGFPACPANFTFTQTGTYTFGCAAYDSSYRQLCTAGVANCQIMTVSVREAPTATPIPPATPTVTKAPTSTPAPTLEPGTSNLSLILKLTGRDYTKEPRPTLLAKVELLDGVDVARTYLAVPFTLTALAADRFYQTVLTGLPLGTYTVRVKPEGYLSRTTREVSLDSTSQNRELTVAPQCSGPASCILAGDLTDDDSVDIFDFAKNISTVKRDFCLNCAGREGNINGDDNVDIFDFQTELDLLLDNKDKHGDNRADSLSDQIKATQVQTN